MEAFEGDGGEGANEVDGVMRASVDVGSSAA
jgi:hypothetical protein